MNRSFLQEAIETEKRWSQRGLLTQLRDTMRSTTAVMLESQPLTIHSGVAFDMGFQHAFCESKPIQLPRANWLVEGF